MMINPFTKEIINNTWSDEARRKSAEARKRAAMISGPTEPFKSPLDPYVKRDRKVRGGLASKMGVSLKEVEDMDWKDVLEMAREAGVDTDYD